MKKLPLGIQDFTKIRQQDYIYVDKTEYLYRLMQQQYYFLSRPRRFGKSLLVSTLKEIFSGNKELFQGLYIYDKIEWKKHPIIHFDFSKLSHKTKGLEVAIDDRLKQIASDYNIELPNEPYPAKFLFLIEELSKEGQVVFLVDEYDRPIIDHLENIKTAEKNREILKNFYSVIKGSDSHIRFVLLTGVSKFSRVSIFSDLNNLTDITIDKNFSCMIGWTKEEVAKYFKEYLASLEEEYKDIYQDIWQVLQEWYNGYSWDGKNFLFNPVSLMNLFQKQTFDNYWFSIATPTFLTKLVKNGNYNVLDIEKSMATSDLLDKYEIDNITLMPLLFQTGYLTIKNYDKRTRIYTMDYPNREVAESFTSHLLSELTTGSLDKSETLLLQILNNLNKNDISAFITNLNLLLKNIPYSIVENSEKYFHSLFYMVIRIIGFKIDAEILTIDGRIDAAVFTENLIYIFEFKIDQSADIAIQQIKDRDYAMKYKDDQRKKLLVGINFDTETKQVADYKTEEC